MKKIFVMTVLLLSLFVLVTPSIANAQSLSAEDIKAQMVKEWERSKAYTIDYFFFPARPGTKGQCSD